MSGSFIKRRNEEGAPGQRRRGQVPRAAVEERKAAGARRGASICLRSHSAGISMGQADAWFSVLLCVVHLRPPPAGWLTPTTK